METVSIVAIALAAVMVGIVLMMLINDKSEPAPVPAQQPIIVQSPPQQTTIIEDDGDYPIGFYSWPLWRRRRWRRANHYVYGRRGPFWRRRRFYGGGNYYASPWFRRGGRRRWGMSGGGGGGSGGGGRGGGGGRRGNQPAQAPVPPLPAGVAPGRTTQNLSVISGGRRVTRAPRRNPVPSFANQ